MVPYHSKLDAVQEQVDDVKQIMVENIDKVLEREEALILLQNKTDSLQENATKFQYHARNVKNRFCIENIKMKILIGSAGFMTLFLIIVLLVISAKKN